MAEPERFEFAEALPPLARGAVEIVQELAAAGHQALLAGGCVRDLLLGRVPEDYDVATDAPPDRVAELFRKTRLVGAQFGVALVKRQRRWIEVATFRSDGPYLDGRHPASVTLSDAEHDAQRRDFTVNGMFLDPLSHTVIDYVGGRADLERCVVRAIGVPAERFAEDYLRMLRAVRFAAKLEFPIETQTLAAVRAHAAYLPEMAAERIREELERMFAHSQRQRAWRLLGECGLREYLWSGAGWSDDAAERIDILLGRLPEDAGFEVCLAVMLADRSADEIERVSRDLTLSNEQLATVHWLVAHQANLDQPQAPDLASLKRLMAHPAFDALQQWAVTRYQDSPEGDRRAAVLEQRLAAIDPATVRPAPLVRGDDLLARQVPAGPVYAEILEALYTQQLNGLLSTREAALAELDRLLRARDEGGQA